MLGVDLEIEASGGDCGACAARQQDDEKAAAVGAEKATDDPPEHGSIGGLAWHHSPRRIGAGSYLEARRSGRALPRIVTPPASAIITKKTMSEGSGAAPKIGRAHV